MSTETQQATVDCYGFEWFSWTNFAVNEILGGVLGKLLSNLSKYRLLFAWPV